MMCDFQQLAECGRARASPSRRLGPHMRTGLGHPIPAPRAGDGGASALNRARINADTLAALSAIVRRPGFDGVGRASGSLLF